MLKRAKASKQVLNPEMLELLASENILRVMDEAVAAGRPPLEAVGDLLFSRFGSAVTSDTVKRAIGRRIRITMEGRGFKLIGRAYCARPCLFVSASTYRP